MPVRRRLTSLLQRPATFAEAGVAAPFTTPPIAQARLRLDHRDRIEVVVRNPAGSDGNYVMPLKALDELFRLSIHDRTLLEKLDELRPVSPWTIRRVGLELAVEGLAGPDAKDAAERARHHDEECALLTMLVLLEQLLSEAGLSKIDWKTIKTGDKQVRERLRPHFKSLEPSIGVSAEELVKSIDGLSDIVAPVGLNNAPFKSFSDKTLADVSALKHSIAEWRKSERDEVAGVAELIVDCAALTITCAEQSLSKAKTLVSSAGSLLEAYAAKPEQIEEVLTRPIWLLAGWRHLLALWHENAEKTRDDQREAIFEIGELVPLVPLSAEEWLDEQPKPGRSAGEIRRFVRSKEDWRTGLMIERQAALEQRQAASL